METNKTSHCPGCGVELQYVGNFCACCGAPLQNKVLIPEVPKDHIETIEVDASGKQPSVENRVMESDGEEIREEIAASEEISEGELSDENIQADAVVAEDNANGYKPLFTLGIKEREKSHEDYVRSIWGNVIALVLSLMFLGVSFLPMLSMRVAVSEKSQATVHVSMVDNVVFAVDSFYFLSDKQLIKTQIYREIPAVYKVQLEEETENGVVLGLKESALLRNWKPMLRLQLMSFRTPVDVGIILNALATVGYMGLCLGFFIRALVHLIFAAIKKERRNCWYNIQLACFAPLSLPALYFLMSITYRFGRIGRLSSLAGFSLQVGWGFVLSMILSVGMLIAAVIVRFYTCRGKKPTRRVLYHLAVAALALLMISSAFLPVVSMKLKTSNFFSGDGVSFALNDFSIRSLEEVGGYNHMSAYDLHEEILAQMEARRWLPFTSSVKAELLSDTVSDQIMLGSMAGTFYIYYTFVMCVTFVILLIAPYFFGAATLGAAHGECDIRSYGRKRWSWLKVMFCIVLVLMLSIYFIAVFRMLALSLRGFMNFNMGTGIFTGLLATLGVCILLRKKKKKIFFDKDYDNADVSYAPYVLDDTE